MHFVLNVLVNGFKHVGCSMAHSLHGIKIWDAECQHCGSVIVAEIVESAADMFIVIVQKKEGEAQDRLTTAANPENGVSAPPTNGIVQQETPSVKNGISETEETSVGLEYSAI